MSPFCWRRPCGRAVSHIVGAGLGIIFCIAAFLLAAQNPSEASDYAYSDFPITLLEALTIYERLRTRTEKGILASLRIGKTNLRDSALLALESVDLGHRAEALVSTLSGGEMKRFYLSRALISSPALLILDEPSSGLDPKRAEEIYELIRHVHEKHHLTVIAVEHNLGAARRYSDRILELKDGRLTESEALHA